MSSVVIVDVAEKSNPYSDVERKSAFIEFEARKRAWVDNFRHIRAIRRYHRIRRTIFSILALDLVFIFCLFVYHAKSWQACWVETNFDQLGPDLYSVVEQHRWHMPPLAESHVGRSVDTIDDRYLYSRELSAGLEGSTKIYWDEVRKEDVVVKVFSTTHHPLRNSIPEILLPRLDGGVTKWPAEIPASLLLAGYMNDSLWAPSNGIARARNIVPVYDYFLRQDPLKLYHQWHLVTPLIPGGTLNTLARRIRHGELVHSVSAVHQRYLPAFQELNRTIAGLHAQGYCHDDIKPTNVLVTGSSHWMLSDLGAVREIGHRWHNATVWDIMDQLRDCRQNDIRRAMRVYLSFLRKASRHVHGDTATFDQDFWAGERDWSRMYWQQMATVDEVPEKLRKLAAEGAWVSGSPPSRWAPLRLILSDRYVNAYAVSRELRVKRRDSWTFWLLRDWMLLGQLFGPQNVVVHGHSTVK